MEVEMTKEIVRQMYRELLGKDAPQEEVDRLTEKHWRLRMEDLAEEQKEESNSPF